MPSSFGANLNEREKESFIINCNCNEMLYRQQINSNAIFCHALLYQKEILINIMFKIKGENDEKNKLFAGWIAIAMSFHANNMGRGKNRIWNYPLGKAGCFKSNVQASDETF